MTTRNRKRPILPSGMLEVSDVMVALGVSRQTVLREWHEGRLRGRRRSLAPHAPVLIEQSSVDEYLRKLGEAEQSQGTGFRGMGSSQAPGQLSLDFTEANNSTAEK